MTTGGSKLHAELQPCGPRQRLAQRRPAVERIGTLAGLHLDDFAPSRFRNDLGGAAMQTRKSLDTLRSCSKSTLGQRSYETVE
jgi:hypothetical protein